MKLANRSQELNFFMEMMRRAVPQRILLIQAASGYGKTDLLAKFGNSCPERWQLVTLDLKDANSGVIYFISRLQQKLGCHHFHHYERVAQELLMDSVYIANNRIVGDENTFQVILGNNKHERNLRLSRLQNAFFRDLAEFTQPILILLDTFNGAPKELRSWLGNRFLAEVAELQKLVVVIAGQEVPSPTIEWRNCYHYYRLDTILEVDAWCKYAQEQGFVLNADHIWAVVRLMKGRPDEIAKALQILEREQS